MNDFPVIIAQMIRERRLMLNIKQEHMAEVLGIKQSQYGRIERGLSPITLDRLATIANELNFDLLQLIYDAYKFLGYESGYIISLEDLPKHTEKLTPQLQSSLLEILSKRVEKDMALTNEGLKYLRTELEIQELTTRTQAIQIKDLKKTIQILEENNKDKTELIYLLKKELDKTIKN